MAVNVYSNCSTLVANTCYLYNNSNLTSPVSNGKYSDGIDCYTVTGGAGQITSVEECPPPTYTVELYSKHGASSSPGAIEIEWSTNDISYVFAATQGVTTTCTQLFPSPAIEIAQGGTIYFKVRDANTTNYIYFDANNGTANNCPANAATTCTYSFTVNSNTSVNITAYVNAMFGTFLDCP
jgi:hypothetical protein